MKIFLRGHRLFLYMDGRVLDAAMEAVGPVSEEDLGGFLGGNATDFYRLGFAPSLLR